MRSYLTLSDIPQIAGCSAISVSAKSKSNRLTSVARTYDRHAVLARGARAEEEQRAMCTENHTSAFMAAAYERDSASARMDRARR